MSYMINMLKGSKEIMNEKDSIPSQNNPSECYRYSACDGAFYTYIGRLRFSFYKGLNGGVWQKKEARDKYINFLNDSCGEIICEAAEAV